MSLAAPMLPARITGCWGVTLSVEGMQTPRQSDSREIKTNDWNFENEALLDRFYSELDALRTKISPSSRALPPTPQLAPTANGTASLLFSSFFQYKLSHFIY